MSEPTVRILRFGNRYFENLNPEEEVPGRKRVHNVLYNVVDEKHLASGRHRWIDYAQVGGVI